MTLSERYERVHDNVVWTNGALEEHVAVHAHTQVCALLPAACPFVEQTNNDAHAFLMSVKRGVPGLRGRTRGVHDSMTLSERYDRVCGNVAWTSGALEEHVVVHVYTHVCALLPAARPRVCAESARITRARAHRCSGTISRSTRHRRDAPCGK